MIITSYHPVYSFDSDRKDRGMYHKFALRKTKEISFLWYLYVREFLGKEADILIVDQNGNYPIDYLLEKAEENFDISSALNFDFNDKVKLNIKKFDDKVQIRRGVKRLYHFIYKFCYYNNLDLFFIEDDCLVARDLVAECQNFDFGTNTIDQKHRVCDTYINFIKAARLKEQDALQSLPEFLDHIANFDTSTNEYWGHEDLSSMILNERGTYLKFCYGDIITFNNDRVWHGGTDQELIDWLEKHPIKHPFYDYFVENGKRIIKEISELKDKQA